jgi:hypothetical protein
MVKHLITPLVVALLLTGCEPEVTEWEHGYKTDRVIATRYNNPHMGYNIGFTFPKNPASSDTSDIWEFLEKANDGWIFQGGGYPGAEVFVVFKDVKDRDSANIKLKKILPPLTQIMRSHRY